MLKVHHHVVDLDIKGFFDKVDRGNLDEVSPQGRKGPSGLGLAKGLAGISSQTEAFGALLGSPMGQFLGPRFAGESHVPR